MIWKTAQPAPPAMSEQEFVDTLYRLCLGRPPDPAGLEDWSEVMRSTRDPTRVLRGIMESPEYALRGADEAGVSHPAPPPINELQIYAGYTPQDLAVLDAFDTAHPAPAPGFVTDFIGSRSRTASLWEGLEHLDGQVLPRPVPADYHAETIEWIGVLKSVLTAQGSFAAMELGAGMGPWLVASATAARLRDIHDIHLIGVEGDPGRFEWMVQHLRDNGIDPDQHTLLQAAVGVAQGVARWPRLPDPRNAAAARPLREQGASGSQPNEDDTKYLKGMSSGGMIEVTVISFENLLRKLPFWDLVHIDVQGTEHELCQACIQLLTDRVRYIVVGTHSRKIDGDMVDTMWGAGWILENEKPTRFVFNKDISSLERMGTHDGTQVWRNPKFG
jgi:FkbM family methyltransferase